MGGPQILHLAVATPHISSDHNFPQGLRCTQQGDEGAAIPLFFKITI